MKIGYYDRKNTGERLSLIPDDGAETTILATYFPDCRQSSKGTISLPYSLESFRRVTDIFGDKYKTTLKSKLPLERLQARDIIEKAQRAHCEEAHALHLQSFIDSEFDPNQPEALPEEFEPQMEPMSHQRAALNYILAIMDERKGFPLYFDMGLGKTFTTLSLLEYLIELGIIKNALVLAPLTTLWSSWADDVAKMTGLTCNVLYSRKNGKYKMRELENVITHRHAHIYVTNFETFRIDPYRELFNERYQFDCMVIDESSRIKNPKSLTYKKTQAFADDNDIEWRFCLSGTPAPKGVTDLWSQFMFLDGGIALGESWKQFEENYTDLLPSSKFVRIPRKGAHRQVHERIRPYVIVFKKDDVLDLPPRMHILKLVDMDSSARLTYENIEEEGLAIINTEDGEQEIVEADNIFTKLQRCRQLTGGFLYREERVPGEGPMKYPSRKNEACLDIVQGIMEQNEEDKVIIWGTFRFEMERLCGVLADNKIKHVRAFGGIGANRTLQAIDSFNNDDTIRVIVASRASIGTGTNLQVANYAIYYSLDEDLEKYLQSLDRIYRIGQTKRVINYYLVTRGTYDERLVTLLRKKETMQNFLTQGEKFTRAKMRNSNILSEWKIED